MKHLLIVAAMVVAGATTDACGSCSPTEPSGPPAFFSGSIPAGGFVVHDVDVPPDTDSVEVTLTWAPVEATVRIVQIDSSCDPTVDVACRHLTDPVGPQPNSGVPTITSALNHQGTAATGRVRFVLQNTDGQTAALHSTMATPTRRGCN